MIIITKRETSRNSERHFCRNLRCRTKLSVPVENHHHAFCASGCFDHFYRSRCLVCEKDITVDPMTGQRRRRSGHRKFCGRKCKAEAAKFPHAFRLPTKLSATSKSADKSRAKTRLEDDRAPFRSLAHWWWGGDPDNGDHSLYDDDGLTIARIVSEGDRYCLRTPVTGPRVSSPDLEQAKRRAENLALSNLPLVGGVNIEAAEVARINAANTKPHPMGPPLNRPRPVNTGDAVLLGEITEAKVPGDPGPIPEIPATGAAMRARKPESPLAYVYDGQRCLGHVLGRGKLGFEAFTANEQSIGLFATARQAADGLLIKGGVA